MLCLRVGVISFWDRTATPYLEKYERMLNEKNIDYKVIFWNRTGTKNYNLDCKENEIIHICRANTLLKIIDFVLWKNKIINKLKKEKYDFLIILSTYPAVLLSSYIFKNYKLRYIFDIRDYSMEKNCLFGYLVSKLIDNSKFTAISSKGFMRWLAPSRKIIINHNITYYMNNYEKKINLKKNKKINFAFVGNIRLDKQTEKVLLNLKNSSTYVSGFIGRILPTCNIIQLCKENNIKNVYFYGQFSSDEKPDIYRDVDLINSIYANDDKNIRLADSTPLPNRLYDAAVFKCPIVASKGTYLADLIEEYNLGFSVNGFDKDIEKQFNEFIESFDEKKFRDGCDRFLQNVLHEENEFANRFNEALKTIGEGELHDSKF